MFCEIGEGKCGRVHRQVRVQIDDVRKLSKVTILRNRRLLIVKIDVLLSLKEKDHPFA